MVLLSSLGLASEPSSMNNKIGMFGAICMWFVLGIESSHILKRNDVRIERLSSGLAEPSRGVARWRCDRRLSSGALGENITLGGLI